MGSVQLSKMVEACVVNVREPTVKLPNQTMLRLIAVQHKKILGHVPTYTQIKVPWHEMWSTLLKANNHCGIQNSRLCPHGHTQIKVRQMWSILHRFFSHRVIISLISSPLCTPSNFIACDVLHVTNCLCLLRKLVYSEFQRILKYSHRCCQPMNVGYIPGQSH